jgi:hypothetical protein
MNCRQATVKIELIEKHLRPIPTGICDLYLPGRRSCDLYLPDLRPIPTNFLGTCDLYLPGFRSVATYTYRRACGKARKSLGAERRKGQLRPIPTGICDLYLPPSALPSDIWPNQLRPIPTSIDWLALLIRSCLPLSTRLFAAFTSLTKTGLGVNEYFMSMILLRHPLLCSFLK